MAQDRGPMKKAKARKLIRRQRYKLIQGATGHSCLVLVLARLEPGLGTVRGRRKARGSFIAILYYCIILKSHNSIAELTKTKGKTEQNIAKLN